MSIHTKLKNKGFIAFITALVVSTALMLSALTVSQSVGLIFDEVNHKQYRISATEATLVCADKVFIELEHDYFYHVEKPGIFYPGERCAVVSVSDANFGSSSSDINKPSAQRSIIIEGYSGLSSTTPGSITANLSAQVLLSSQNIGLMSENTKFY